MNCVRWSMGDAALHGIGTSLVPCQCFGCHPCLRTKLLPMSLDRTKGGLTSRSNGPGTRVARARPLSVRVMRLSNAIIALSARLAATTLGVAVAWYLLSDAATNALSPADP